MKKVFTVMLAAAGMMWAASFTGTITDNGDPDCAKGDHADMKMGNDAQCTIGCVKGHGAKYVLYDGKQTYVLSDQKTPQQYAAKKVVVTGTLDTKTKTIQVDSIAPAR